MVLWNEMRRLGGLGAGSEDGGATMVVVRERGREVRELSAVPHAHDQTLYGWLCNHLYAQQLDPATL